MFTSISFTSIPPYPRAPPSLAFSFLPLPLPLPSSQFFTTHHLSHPTTSHQLLIHHYPSCQHLVTDSSPISSKPRTPPITSNAKPNPRNAKHQQTQSPLPRTRPFPSQKPHTPTRKSKTVRQVNNNTKALGTASVLINGSPAETRAYLHALQRGDEHMSLLQLNEVATTLCRMRRVNQALALVELWERKPLSDQLAKLKSVKSFTIMIDVYGKAHQLSRAFALFYNMPRLGLQPNLITYNAIIAACARNNEPDLAYQVFEEMQQKGMVPDKFTYGSLIDSCAKSGQVERAFEIYRLMDPKGVAKDPAIYCTLMDACGRAQQLERAFMVFEEMKRDGVWPNLVTFSVLIGMCANARQPQRAFQLFSEIRHWDILRANVVVYTALIEACAKAGWPERAEMVMSAMIESGVRPNEITYGALMDGWTRHGRIDKAFEIIDRMVDQHGLTPNAILIGGLIESCRKLGEMSRAKSIWAVVVQYNIRPPPSYYPSLIVMAAKNGDIEVALAIVMHAYARGSLRRVSLKSENPTLRALACAIAYLDRVIADTVVSREEQEKYTSRLRVVLGSTAMRAKQMEAASSQNLLELGSLT